MDELAEIVAKELDRLENHYVHKAIQLMENENTIPFIARYRSVQTGGMDAQDLREIKTLYDNMRSVRKKVDKIIEKEGESIPLSVKKSLTLAKTLDEVNDLYAPFRKGGKGTLAERARLLGLESPAEQVLKSPDKAVGLGRFVNASTKGLETLKDVRTGVQHVIADIISKDEKLNSMMENFLNGQVSIESKTTEARKKADKETKFAHYYDFCMSIARIKSHQILAINRGEDLKVLVVQMRLSEIARKNIISWLNRRWMPHRTADVNRDLLAASIDDSLKRLIEKKYLRRIRVRLTAKAEREAVEVFSQNLKRLLCAPPVRGRNTLGIDPGFKNGCKIAALDKHGQVLETAVVHPFGNSSKLAEQVLVNLVNKHSCTLIAIGNGTACRETETLIAKMLQENLFKGKEIGYCIVNESGSSVWSVSKEAKSDLPNLDPNLRSAVSIGRRLQDPLLELVKIEPKHIGVGMYQHDVNETLLKAALEGTIEDCVSFVGVDLNSCSAVVLRRIAGLGIKKAETIIEWRDKHGPFTNRKQLLLVKGLGNKCFEQCAGFVRVDASSSNESKASYRQIGRKRKVEFERKPPSKKRKGVTDIATPEPLDQTMIHPESYTAAYKLMDKVGATVDMIGSCEMAKVIEEKTSGNFKGLAMTLGVDEETLSLILRGLKQPLGFDLRSELEQPSFRRDLRSIDDLTVGQSVIGVVSNVTSFGVFINYGVEKDGLIHQRNLGTARNLGPGDKCECGIISIDRARHRVGLQFRSMKSAVPLLR